jgi:DNA-binding response OmpR family regulator
MRLLVVEDEKKIADLLKTGFRDRGHDVEISPDGERALRLALSKPYDAIILDIMLPGTDGLSVLRSLREQKIATPVMILTARGDVSDRVEGLKLGADDYIAKPFSVEEVVARVRALVRRVTGESISLYKVGDLTLDLVSREVKRGNRRVLLTGREFRILEHLMRATGRVLTRTQIIERVWEYRFDPGTNLVDVYIQRLRRKIDDREKVKLIQTVRGVGYRLGPDPGSVAERRETVG